MGLWDWIVDAIVGGGSARADAGRDYATDDEPFDQPTAVAVAEAPETTGIDMETLPPEKRWWQPQGVSRIEPVLLDEPDLTHEDRAFENYLIDHFDGHDLTMPSLPRVPERVLKQLRDPNCDFVRIADDIAEDQVVAGAVLRAVNSPMYRGVDEITSLPLAAARLGVKALRTLMMHQTMRAATFLQKGGNKYLADMVWRRSVAGACIMSRLAWFTKIGEEDAWLIGLLHDVGNVIILQLAQNRQKMTGYRVEIDVFEYLCQQCHQEFGELVADAWHLPPRLKNLLGDHHRYPEPDDSLRKVRLLIQLSDMIAAMLDYAPPAQYDLLATRQIQDLGLAGRADFVRCLAGLPEQTEDAMIYF